MDTSLKQLFKPLWAVFRDTLPPKLHVEIDHFRFHRQLPDLDNPITFSEKIARRKLYDRDPRLPSMIDKIAVKQLMAARFGQEFVIPTLATFESAAEVDFGTLPYPCVLKASHGSGMNVFLMQRPANEMKIRRKLSGYLARSHHRPSEEWAYSQVHGRLLVEPFIDGGEHGLVDYKFHTFGGKVFAIQVDIDRYTDHRRAFFDPAWCRMNFELLYPAPNPSTVIPPPLGLNKMISCAEQIGEGFSYIRVDLYEVAGKVTFGEATFYPGAGLERFNPPEFDALFGAQWQ